MDLCLNRVLVHSEACTNRLLAGPARTGGTVVVPRITGSIRRLRPVEVRDVEFLRANTNRKIKITLPGPFTMSRQAKNEFYKDEEELVMDYAAAVNAEIRDLKATGANVIQLDEPWLQARPQEARRLALPAIDRALEGIPGPTALHLCFGYAYVARDKPNVYAFLPELTASKVDQVSIEAAQPSLDLSTLDGLGDKTVIFGVISMGEPEPETPDRRRPHPRGTRPPAAAAADPRPRLRHEIHPAIWPSPSSRRWPMVPQSSAASCLGVSSGLAQVPHCPLRQPVHSRTRGTGALERGH